MFEVKVVDKIKEAIGVESLILAPINNQPLPEFKAGAHIDVNLANGLTRQYSLCHSPSNHLPSNFSPSSFSPSSFSPSNFSPSNIGDTYQIAVLLDEHSRGGSSYIHEQLQIGDIVHISEPKNLFELELNATKHVLFAGGIGITPLLSMAYFLNEQGANFELHYSAKSKDKAAFYSALKQSEFSNHVFFYLSAEEKRLNVQHILEDTDPNAHLYVCGPENYIEYIFQTAKQMNWPDNQLHREFFQISAEDSSNNEAFQIYLSNSNLTLDIPANSTVLEVLTEAGIDVPFACEQGVCGTCLLRVTDGIPDHRDHYLTPEEQDSNTEFTPCCSRSKTPILSLDL
ncbi:MAG: PDR/VanB family oxidoreductase [Vibrio sp.]